MVIKNKQKKTEFWRNILVVFSQCFSLLMLLSWATVQQNIQAQDIMPDTTQKLAAIPHFSVSYDLRNCKNSFDMIWDYYRALGAQKNARIFDNAQQLRNGSAVGRFATYETIPNTEHFAQSLSSEHQTFAILIWRERKQERIYNFAVQRSLDIYDKQYYPFVVYEDFTFSIEQWNQQQITIGCDESQLFQDIPSSNIPQNDTNLNTPFSFKSQDSASADTSQLTFASLRIPKLKFSLRSQAIGQVQKNAPQTNFPLQAESTVFLPINGAKQLCQWQNIYGEQIIVPAQQLAGSSAWRFRNQNTLPYGLTRLKLYNWGKTPYPMAYTSYNNKNYAIFAGFANGYRLQYLPTKNQSIQIVGTVIFWLQSVPQLPPGLNQTNKNFQSPAYNAPVNCSTNAWRTTRTQK